MKIHLDKIYVTNLNIPANAPIIVRILVGDAEMVTERGTFVNNSVAFPDIYEFNLDDVAFATGLLELEVEVMNVLNPQDPVLLGEGTKILRQLFPRFDASTSLSLGLTLNSNLIRGDVRLQGIITEHETLLDELKLKFYELDGFKKAHEGKLSAASESDMKRALMQVEKANKKNAALQQKFNEIQEKNLLLSNENEKLQIQLTQESKSKLKSAEDTVKMLKNRNDELLSRLNELTQELQKHAAKTEILTTEKATLESQLHEFKDRFDQRLNDSTQQLREELIQVRGELESTKKLITNSGDQSRALLEEINLLKASRSILQSTFGKKEQKDGEDAGESRFDSSHNSLLNLRKRLSQVTDSCVVAVRTRLPSEEELVSGNLVVENNGPSDQVNLFHSHDNRWAAHQFDFHWPYNVDQSRIFQDISFLLQRVIPRPSDICSGWINKDLIKHFGIICRGGKGSGKTFTAFGNATNTGIGLRAIDEIFLLLDKEKASLDSWRKSSHVYYRDVPADMIYEYTVDIALLEIIEDKVYSMIQERKDFARTDFAKRIAFDPISFSTVIDGFPYHRISNAGQGLQLIVEALRQAELVGLGSVVLEVLITVQYQTSPNLTVKSKFILADISSLSADKNIRAIESVYEAISSNQPILPFEDSKLTKILQPLFSTVNKQLVLFNVSPSELDLRTTKAELDLASRLMTSRLPSYNSKALREQKDYEKQISFLSIELRESKKKVEFAQKSLVDTKSLAEELVKQLNDGNKLLLQRYLEEKDLAKQLKHDLALTQRNLKKAIGETQEQRKINERLVKLVKGLEDERNSLNALITEN